MMQPEIDDGKSGIQHATRLFAVYSRIGQRHFTSVAAVCTSRSTWVDTAALAELGIDMTGKAHFLRAIFIGSRSALISLSRGLSRLGKCWDNAAPIENEYRLERTVTRINSIGIIDST